MLNKLKDVTNRQIRLFNVVSAEIVLLRVISTDQITNGTLRSNVMLEMSNLLNLAMTQMEMLLENSHMFGTDCSYLCKHQSRMRYAVCDHSGWCHKR